MEDTDKTLLTFDITALGFAARAVIEKLEKRSDNEPDKVIAADQNDTPANNQTADKCPFDQSVIHSDPLFTGFPMSQLPGW